MFEQELEFERKEGGSFGPIVVIVVLIGLIVGSIGYFVAANMQVLKPEQAKLLINKSFESKGPATILFRTGHLEPNFNDRPDAPNYQLLQKAGIIQIAKGGGRIADVRLTADGEKLISGVPEFRKKTGIDGTTEYRVPIAQRKLLSISKITKLAPRRFQVEYTWKWEPNKLGDVFDISGAYIPKFNGWDRGQLIDKFGADYYNATPLPVTIVVAKAGKIA